MFLESGFTFYGSYLTTRPQRVKDGYNGFTAQVNVGGTLTDPFEVEGGVK